MVKFSRYRYQIRKATPKSGHEMTLPPAFIRSRKEISDDLEEMEVLADTIIVIVPPGVKVNERVLAAAIEEG